MTKAVAKREAINGKPYAGNPHVRFDEENAVAATPQRVFLLHASVRVLAAALCAVSAGASIADTPSDTSRRTRIFIRSQLKYGLERDDYLHDWYERPLHQDTTYATRAPNGGRFLNDLSWRKQVEIGRLTKIDGFGVFLSMRGRHEIIPQSVKPGAEATIMVEMSGRDVAKGIGHCVELAGRALAMPNSFRIGGRVVLTRYTSVPKADPKSLDFFPKLKKALDARYGANRFALIPYANFICDRDSSLSTPAAIERTRENIRGILRRTDGLYYTLTGASYDTDPAESRRYNPVFHDTVVAPIVKSVMAEPEFKGKLLGMGIRQAHENPYRWATFGTDSIGTRTLRDSMSSVALMRPDFILCPEWDEQNENTHFRPITSNGHVTQRIMRYWADTFAGREPEVFPGDDTSIPNLVVSYRKSLQAGDRAEVEVVNIPDGTARTAAYSVSFRWRTPDGRIVREYPAQTLDATRIGAVWFNCPAADLLSAHVLLPELTVSDGSSAPRTFGRGMWPLNVEANRNLDIKWVKNALRETDPDVESFISAGPLQPDGTCEVRGRVKGRTKFRTIEVLDCFDTVYMHDVTGRLSPTSTFVRVAVQGTGGSPGPLKGTITLGASRRVLDFGEFSTGKPYETIFRLSPDEAKGAVVKVRLDGLLERDVSLDSLVPGFTQAFCGEHGASLVVERSLVTPSIPPPCGIDSADFTFRIRPMGRLSVLRLRTVDENFRIHVSPAPVDMYVPSGETRTFHFCEQRPMVPVCAEKWPVREVTVDVARCVEPSWDFSSGGTVFRPAGFPDMPCVFGGGVSLVTGYGRGESRYGSALCRAKTVPPSPGCAATMPMQTVPRFAGFELTLTVKPTDVSRRATLFSSSMRGFVLAQTPDGLAAWFSRRHKANRGKATVKGPRLKAGVWNTVKVLFDQHEAWIEVNGVAGERVPVSGWQFGPMIGGLGISVDEKRDDWFPGTFGMFFVRLR